MAMCRLISVVHLVAHFHVVGIVHDVLDHVLEHRVARNDRIELRVAVFSLCDENKCIDHFSFKAITQIFYL